LGKKNAMIELTPEQWQAIAGAENPTIVEPKSKTAYVVLRKDVYDALRTIVDDDTAPAALLDAITAKVGIELTEIEKALALRVIWMRRMGLEESEITDSLRAEPPASVEQKMKELLALERLKTKPSRESLQKIAIKR
jgi:hypothetical protein